MITVHLLITGIVQGVFYRQSTNIKALKLDLKGWVKNLDDGRVEAVVEGDKNNINQLIEWAYQGPSNAKVEHVNIQYEEYQDEFDNFSIR